MGKLLFTNDRAWTKKGLATQEFWIAFLLLWLVCVAPIAAQTSSEELLRAGDKLFDEQQFSEAAHQYQLAIQQDPSNVLAYEKLGYTFLILGNDKEALLAYQHAVDLASDKIENHHYLAFFHRRTGNTPQALNVLQNAVQINPHSAESHRLLGLLLAYTDQLSEAHNACQQAITLQPESATAYDCLGIILASQGNWAESIKAYQKSIDSAIPSNTEATLQKRIPIAITSYHLALTFAALERQQEASDTYLSASHIFEKSLEQGMQFSGTQDLFPLNALYSQTPLNPKYFALPHKRLGFALKEKKHFEQMVIVFKFTQGLFASLQRQYEQEISDIDKELEYIRQQP